MLGDLAVSDGDIEFRGVRYATDTGEPVVLFAPDKVTGLSPGVARDDTSAATGFGSSRGAGVWGPRVVTATAMLRVADGVDGRTLHGRTLAAGVDPLVFRGYGYPAGPMVTWVEAMAMPGEWGPTEHVAGMLWQPVMWHGHDPRTFTLDEDDQTVGASDVELANDGTWPAPWRATVGPCVGPRWRDTTSGAVLRFDGVTVPSGETLEVDTRAGTAVVDGVDVWHLAVDDAGRPALPWAIPPGGCDMAFARTSGASTSTVHTRGGCWL